MPSRPQPPSTPVLPSHYVDTSLLLSTEPIFGDDSLGDDDLAWPNVRASRLVPRETVERDKTLNLDAYLPEGNGDISVGDVTVRLDGTITSKRALIAGERAGSHKRDGSDPSVGERQVPVSKRQRPVAPILPIVERDDLYLRRMSDSFRPTRSSSPAPSKLLLPDSPIPTTLPPLSSSSSSSSRSEVSSLHYPEGLRGSQMMHFGGNGRISAPARESESSSLAQEHTSRTYAAGSGEQRSSALSRYLAKSSALHARPTIHSRSISPVSALTNPSRPASAQSLTFSVCSTPMPSNDVKIPSKTIIPEQTAGIELEAPTSMTDFIQIAPVSHDITANNFDSRSAPHHPLVSTVEPKPSEAVPLANAATTKESRRTSTSERVLSFFASFLKPPEATAAETDLTAQSEIRQDERDEVKTSAEVVHKNYTEDTHTETSKNICGSEASISSSATQLALRTLPAIQTKKSFIAPMTKPLSQPLSSRRPLKSICTQATAPRATAPHAGLTTIAKHPFIISSSSSSSTSTTSTQRPTTSAFTAAALARLPAPGKGATSSSNPVTIRPTERALDLSRTRAVFERPTSHVTKIRHAEIRRTIPIHGRTPGKASRQRAELRGRFDAEVEMRIEQKEMAKLEDERRKEEEENEQYKQRRKETVIWAKPVPEMYRPPTNNVDS